MRAAHYSKRTEESYVNWIKRFISFHNKKHPNEMGAEEVKNYISYLATNQQVSSSTQNQALNAILYLYKNVLKKEIKFVDGFGYVKRIKHLPVVFSRDEAQDIRTIQELLGHKSVKTTMIYTHVLKTVLGVKSPLDNIL